MTEIPLSRRGFLGSLSVVSAATSAISADCIAGWQSAAAAQRAKDESHPLPQEPGVTTSSFSGHLSESPGPGRFSLLELPQIMRDELGMRIIDLNTSSLGRTDRQWLDQVRAAVDDAGCVLTNLKMNQSGLDMNSPEAAIRNRALDAYRQSIDAAAHLGIPWVRPLPLKNRPDMKIHVDSYRTLADYGAERGVRLLVENYGWMESDPDSIVTLLDAIGRDAAACPDTGNWSDNETRYAGLQASFPRAVTCDFKARELGPSGEHRLYDLERCFRIGIEAGFLGPWCLEHAHADRNRLFRELVLLRDLLRRWMSGI